MDFTSEIFDRFQLLSDVNGFNDHVIHCVMRFERAPDLAILEKSVIRSIESIPILGSRYIDGDRPRWESLDPKNFSRSFTVAPTPIAFEDFILSPFDEDIGPQIKLCVIEGNAPSVAIKMNHMICDAAGFKDYLDFLCEIYSRLSDDPAFRPKMITGDRSLRRVVERFSFSKRVKSLFRPTREKIGFGDHRFPLDASGDVKPFIVTRKLARAKVAALKDYCRAKKATLNDAVLTAYYRSLFQKLEFRPGEELQVPLMVDMRRALAKTQVFDFLTNLTSMESTRLDFRREERFEDSLGRIKAIMDEKKRGDIGLNILVRLDLIFRILGDRFAHRLLRRRLKNPFICMTNVGILDSARISFAGLRPHDAYLCGSIKYKPYFQLAMSSYEGEITLSVNQYGSERDRDSVIAFLAAIESELTER